jgi:hypothetical protein
MSAAQHGRGSSAQVADASALPAASKRIEQRDRALSLAQAIRLMRASQKAIIRNVTPQEARARAAAIISEPEWWSRTWRVEELLLAIPRIGRKNLPPLLMRASVPPIAEIGSLTVRQRLALRYELGVREDEDV